MPSYFLAILPPSEISKEIMAFQKEIEESFGAKHAQKVPPHLTVVPPFDASEIQVSTFTRNLQSFLKTEAVNDIELCLDNFQRFESRTLFVDVAENERLEKLCKDIKLLFNQEKIINQRVEKHFFVPHITLANKDLKKRAFNQLWEEYRERKYQRSFIFTEITVLKKEEEMWVVNQSVKR